MKTRLFVNGIDLEFFNESDQELQVLLAYAIEQENYEYCAEINAEIERRKNSCQGVSIDFLITD